MEIGLDIGKQSAIWKLLSVKLNRDREEMRIKEKNKNQYDRKIERTNSRRRGRTPDSILAGTAS